MWFRQLKNNKSMERLQLRDPTPLLWLVVVGRAMARAQPALRRRRLVVIVEEHDG